MGLELMWTERSIADIEAIVRYVYRRNPEAAARIGSGIFERAQELLSQPDLGSLELSLPEGEWSKLIFRRWKIMYTVRDKAMIVGRVWPCAPERDLKRLLDDGGE